MKQVCMPGNGGGITYSTTETLTGDKWIDGKPIYRRVYEYTGKSATESVYLDTSLQNSISTLVNTYGCRAKGSSTTSNLFISLPQYTLSAGASGSMDVFTSIIVNTSGVKLNIANSVAGAKYYVVLEYTKN